AQRGAHVACGGGFLLGRAEILRSFKFTAKENRLRDSTGQTPDEGIERADSVKCRASAPAGRAEHKARQARRARLVHPMKSSGEAALTGDEVGPAFQDLRGQTGGHGPRLTGEGTSHIKRAGRVATGHDLDGANRLRPRRLCGVERIPSYGGARLDLRNVEVARKPLLFAHVSEL